MIRLVARLTPRSGPRNAAWFGVVLTVLLLAGTPPLACAPRTAAVPSETAPPVEDTEQKAPDEAREARAVSARQTPPPVAARPIAPPLRANLLRGTCHSARPDPFANGLGMRLRC